MGLERNQARMSGESSPTKRSGSPVAFARAYEAIAVVELRLGVESASVLPEGVTGNHDVIDRDRHA